MNTSASSSAKGEFSAIRVSKRYRKRFVLQDVSLRVARGEAVALLGPNGAGKTTCFSIMTGLMDADAGRILLDGEDVTAWPMHRRAALGVGYLPQEPSIFRGLSVEENISGVLQARGLPRERRDELLEHLLAGEPNYMLLDEPLAGIDPIAVGDIRDTILHLKSRGIGVLITDHNVRDTLRVVDRAYILSEGKVLYDGTPSEIAAHAEVRNVYLGHDFEF